MLKILEALQYHHGIHGVAVEVQTPDGWTDVKKLADPVEALVKELWAYCDAEIVDSHDLNMLSDYMRGRAQFAARVQEIIKSREVLVS